MRKHIFTLMALAATLCACEKEQMIESEVTNPEVEPSAPLVFTATMEGVPSSKATFDNTAKCAAWEVGDQISLNGSPFYSQSAGTSSFFSKVLQEIRPSYLGTSDQGCHGNDNASNLVDDGGTSTRWCVHKDQKGFGEFWMIDVSTGHPTVLQTIKLWNANNTASYPNRVWKDIKVLGRLSSAEGNFSAIKSMNNLNLVANNSGLAGEIDVNATVPYDEYRIIIYNNKGDDYMQMADMKFVVYDPDIESPYTAYFPETLYNGGQTTLPSLMTETWTDGKFNMPLYARSNTTNLQFKNLCGVLKITVKNDVMTSVKKIRISSSNKATSGIFTVLDDNKVVLAQPDNVANTMTVTYSNAVSTTADGTDFYIAIPPQTYRELKIELYRENGFVKTMVTKNGVDINVERNKIYPVTFTSNVEAVGENCYIISAPGVPYTFPCKKGQSMDYLAEGKSVKVLWESFGTATMPNPGDVVTSVSYKDGWVSVTGNNEGNAVLALYDGENGTGNILWSWHIWVCNGFDPDNIHNHTYKNGKKVMDRNLGALSATPGQVSALGLLYQWGRKDPFRGASSTTSSTITADVAKSTGTWESPIQPYYIGNCIEYSIKHPMCFITSDVNTNDWCYNGGYNDRWTTSDKAKSEYDPCPAGWRVPDGGPTGLWSTSFGLYEVKKGIPKHSKYNGEDFGKNNTSMQLSLQDEVVWYPITGALTNSGGVLHLKGGPYRGYCWSASATGLNAYDLHYVIESDGLILNIVTGAYRAAGKSVRCVREVHN